MTFAAALDETARYLGRESLWCGELPTGHALHLAFAEYRHCDDETYFPDTLHRCAAGLVAAHSRSAAVRTDPDDVIAAWELAAAQIVELEAEIDHVVAVRIPASRDDAVEYPEGFGAVVGGLAYLYCHSPRFGPALGKRNPYSGVQLVLRLAPGGSYSALTTGLNAGSVRLPPSTI
ncbi:hypothetical protein [Nocardia sp. NPDC004711]